jgi:hypothetical protein
MDFQQAVRSTEGLRDAYQAGLHALKNADRARIDCENPASLTGSVDLDSELVGSHPNATRWDYGIGVRKGRGSESVIWLEVHPATSHGAEEVCRKHRWLRQWLVSSAPFLANMPGQFVWIASGNVHIPLNSPHRRRLALQGIQFRGRRLRL